MASAFSLPLTLPENTTVSKLNYIFFSILQRSIQKWFFHFNTNNQILIAACLELFRKSEIKCVTCCRGGWNPVNWILCCPESGRWCRHPETDKNKGAMKGKTDGNKKDRSRSESSHIKTSLEWLSSAQHIKSWQKSFWAACDSVLTHCTSSLQPIPL